MSLPFLKLKDIYRAWVELLHLLPQMHNEEEKNNF